MTTTMSTPVWNGTCHPAADLFPMLEDTELASLVAAIKEHGLNNPGWLLPDGTLLDGRNRRLACEQAGVDMRWRAYEGDDEIGFAISENVERRHLTTGQKAMAALAAVPLYAAQAKARQSAAGVAFGKGAKLGADLPQAIDDTPTPPAPKQRAPRARDEAAKAFKTSGKSVAQAKRVMEKAPELAAKVAAGTLSLDAAEKEVKVAERVAKQSMTTTSSAGPTTGFSATDVVPELFTTIVIDPPWRYSNTSTRAAAENHYQTMSHEELLALELPAANDAHLYLWVTNSFIGDGLELMAKWGFTQKTMLTWCKPQIGMGNYFRSSTEHVLFGVRGKLSTQRNNVPTWFVANRTEHSAKPESFYDLVEASSPGPYLEMFARRRRLNWSTWGNEA